MTRGVRAGELRRIFNALEPPRACEGREYQTVRILPDSRYRIGRDRAGDPAILIETSGQAGALALSDFTGRHLRISHGVRCSISDEGGEVGQAQFSVVTCSDSDDLLQDRFFEVVETLLNSLGETPAVEELRSVIGGLIELFRLATRAPQGTIQGLWAELWVISQAGEPRLVVDAWHREGNDLYDFNIGPQRLEIKSTSNGTRRHMFSHRQLIPPPDTQVVIGSIFVESSGTGAAISTLVNRIRRRVSEPRLLRKLDYIVASTLGDRWRASVGATFDSELAAGSLRFYNAEAVPSLSSETPSGVSDIRYISDLSGTCALSREEMLGEGQLFAAVSPMYP